MEMRYQKKRCPLLKNEKVIYCRNYPIRKMLPIEKVFENENLCLKESHRECPLYDATKVDPRNESRICPFVDFETMSFCQAYPLKKIAANELIFSPCNSEKYENCAIYRKMAGCEIQTYKGFSLDSAKSYFENHLWVERKNGSALVGIDDFGQFVVGEVLEVQIREEGEKFSEKEWLFRLKVPEGNFEFLSPFGGMIVEANKNLQFMPQLINLDPYGCWIAKVKIEGEIFPLGPEEAKRILDSHIERVFRIVQSGGGLTMADGGELSRDARRRIKDRRLISRLIEELLKGREV